MLTSFVIIILSFVHNKKEERRIEMGRDDSKSKGTNKDSLPQTPHKIAPNKVKEEIAEELEELHQLVKKAKGKVPKKDEEI